MRLFSVLPVVALSALAVGCSGFSKGDGVKKYAAKEFFETTIMMGGSFTHDEKSILVSSNESRIFNIQKIDLESGRGDVLTKSATDGVWIVSAFPQDSRILYSQDRGGNELNHLYVIERDGSVKDLTPGEKHRASFMGWSQDEQKFWVLSNERDPRFFDLYEYSAKDYARRLIYENKLGRNPQGISRDGHWLVVSQVKSNDDSELFLVDLKNSKSKPRSVVKNRKKSQEEFFSFSVDGRDLYYGTDAQSDFTEAWKLNLASGKTEPVLTGKWDVVALSFSKNGRYRISYRNEDASYKMSLYDLKENKEVSLPAMPQGQILKADFSRSERYIAFYVNGDTSPSDLYLLDLQTSSVKPMTNNLSPKVSRTDLVESERITYPSFDGLEIPALLYKPKQASKDRKVPVLLWVHGGPGGQSIKMYSPNIQFLVNHGIAILAVNNRGSSGYGKAFFHADDRKHGDVDLKDCIWSKNYLKGLDWVDGNRIGIMGGSYGGYMTAAALTFAPEEFKVGINIFGVTNWLRTLEQIPVWWGAERDSLYAEIGDPVKDREMLIAKSPLFHAEKITKPLLVVQGANDPRVLQVESDEIVAKARKNGVPVEYVLFSDEGHGFTKRENQVKAAEAYLKFSNENL